MESRDLANRGRADVNEPRALTVAITGATGLIGRALVQALLDRGDRVVALVRHPPRPQLPAQVEQRAWSSSDPAAPLAAPPGVDAVVHLAGAPIAQRWTEARKRSIADSRILGTRSVLEGIRATAPGVRTLVCASGIDYFGDTGAAIIDERAPKGTGFTADLTERWEHEAHRAEAFGCRVVCLRTGMVLAAEGGALGKLVPLFRMGLGGKLGTGRQMVPWIHLADEVGLILHALDQPELRGELIASAPTPVSNAAFTRALAAALHRKAIFHVPATALRLVLGEMAELLLASHDSRPRRALESGYAFRFEDLDAALADLFPR